MKPTLWNYFRAGGALCSWLSPAMLLSVLIIPAMSVFLVSNFIDTLISSNEDTRPTLKCVGIQQDMLHVKSLVSSGLKHKGSEDGSCGHYGFILVTDEEREAPWVTVASPGCRMCHSWDWTQYASFLL